MTSHPFRLLDCPHDILLSILDQLSDDTRDLSSLSLASKSLHELALPVLLKNVDLSCHNNGRLPEQEDEYHPEVHADFSDEYRPLNLVPRQRAFLRLMTDRPQRAAHVQSFSWTLVWYDFDEESLMEIDFELWNVFSRLINVRRLDLASIRQIPGEPFVRKNPTPLFPAVTHLRLLGWMHRGLVDAILNSLDPNALYSLSLDHLQDEGAFPDGSPLPEGIVRMQNDRPSHMYKTGCLVTASDDFYERQQTGRAWIFPGPMWSALRIASRLGFSALSKFELLIPPFDMEMDPLNYFTCFLDLQRFLFTVAKSLKLLTIVFGGMVHYTPSSGCGNGRYGYKSLQLWNIGLAVDFLSILLDTFDTPDFPLLERVTIQASNVLSMATQLRGELRTRVAVVRQRMQGCAFISWETVSEDLAVDYNRPFKGYDDYLSPKDKEKFSQFVH